MKLTLSFILVCLATGGWLLVRDKLLVRDNAQTATTSNCVSNTERTTHSPAEDRPVEVGRPVPGRAESLPEVDVHQKTATTANNDDAAICSVLISGVPHVRQKPDFCGEACAAMYLAKLGKHIDQDAVFNQSGLDPALGRGCYTQDLATALTRIGFDVGPVHHFVTANHAEKELQSLFHSMHDDLVAGIPSIICTRYDDQPNTTEHFRLVLGYDSHTDEVVYHEPAAAEGAYRRMNRAEVLKLWPLKYEPRRWTVIRLRLRADEIRDVKPTTSFSSADFAQHVMRQKQRIPKPFTIVVQHPFVVIGDETPSTVQQRAIATVKWSVDRLKKSYFPKDPDGIIDIWLFKDNASYQRYTKEIFGDTPTTPFGYFSHSHNALIMNIATGGGTLVHEIVHAFVASNFPDCPAWFNEGLASLYEQCGDRQGTIWGYTNWRLAGLQDAISNHPSRVTSFDRLCQTTTHQFYNEDPGSYYAQARYLCYYLQERGLLKSFHDEFHRNRRNDPSGYQTLRTILGKEANEMDEFQKSWEAWVLKLHFP